MFQQLLNYQLPDNWWMEPFGQFGFGKYFSGNKGALIYGASIKSFAPLEKRYFGIGLTAG